MKERGVAMIPTEDIIPTVKNTITASIKCNTHRGYIGWSSCDNICMDMHVYDGYVYMKSLGYDEVAKICLTHSFNNHTIDEYIGKFDVTDEELTIMKTELSKTIYDEYDRLIQLCDCLAGAEGVLDIENRMNDVKKRYGFYPQDKWNSNMKLKQYFEGKMNKDIYIICEKDRFVPGDL